LIDIDDDLMRPIRYGCPALEDEEPDFVTGARFLYPRSFALT
jgi:hypothetical protein